VTVYYYSRHVLAEDAKTHEKQALEGI
jgi:hypothetical protein